MFRSLPIASSFADNTMPSQSTLTEDEKAKVKSAIPVSPTANKIFSSAPARIYYAYPQPEEWSYAGLQGALTFVRDNTKNTSSFKLVDLTGTRGVIWEYELYEGIEYFADRAFFHSFPGDVGGYYSPARLAVDLCH